MGKYHKFKDYEGTTIDPKSECLYLACCDCGLVHHTEFSITEDEKVIVAFLKKVGATAQLRRHNYGYLQQDKINRYTMAKRLGL